MTDYTIFYKSNLPIDEQWDSIQEWDVFIAAYNSSQRVQKNYELSAAKNKYWIVFPEYKYNFEEFPSGSVFPTHETLSMLIGNESEFLNQFWDWLQQQHDLRNSKICIDITGFIRPHLSYIIKLFKDCGIKIFDAIYSEPVHYKERELTRFTPETVSEVRQIAGFEGVHNPDTSEDLLIIGVGYDSHLISEVAERKNHAEKLQIFGFPSLRADMFQENILKTHQAKEAIGGIMPGDELNSYYVPANDPFVTANELGKIIKKYQSNKNLTNLYLCSLATKPQVLGFTLYYLRECQNTAVSMIFPFSSSYSRESTTGIARIWKYTIELD